MKRMSDLLGIAIGNPEILRAARANRVLEEWKEIVGEYLAERTKPDRFEKGVVVVLASGSAWAQEILMRQEEVVARLNERAGEPLFRAVRVTIYPRLREEE